MKPIDKVVRVVQIPYEDESPKRHTWYLYHAKVGTTNSTIVWVADKEEIQFGDIIFFVDEFDLPMKDKNRYVKYPSTNAMFKGTVTDINEWLIFISK